MPGWFAKPASWSARKSQSPLRSPGEHPARAIAAVGRGGEADQQQRARPDRRTRERARPVRLAAIAPGRRRRDRLAMAHQPRAEPAAHDAAGEPAQTSRCLGRTRADRQSPRHGNDGARALTSRVPALIVHGGAGADPADEPDELRRGIAQALAAGWAVLRAGGRALDAVEAAVRVLEDHPRFNAGRGSVLTARAPWRWTPPSWRATRSGTARWRRSPASGIRSRLARRILEDGRHSLFVGAGAAERARRARHSRVRPRGARHRRRRKQLEALSARHGRRRRHRSRGHDRRGARRPAGRAGKLPGRVGDSRADRLRHLRGEHARRRVVHGRRRGDHPRRARPPRARHPEGGRRPGPRLRGRARRAGGGGPRRGRPHRAGLEGPHGVGPLDAAHAGRPSVPRRPAGDPRLAA